MTPEEKTEGIEDSEEGVNHEVVNDVPKEETTTEGTTVEESKDTEERKEEESGDETVEDESKDGGSEEDKALEEYIKLKRKKKEEEEVSEEAKEEEEVEIVDEEEDEKGYRVKLKPELDDETKKALKLREQQKKKQPAFRRQEWFRYKRLGESWRRPKGLHSKMRKNLKYRSPRARVGYRKVKAARGLHPSGFEDVLVHNLKELQEVNPKTQAARIGRTVGNRKRKDLQEYAKEKNIRILNWKEVEQ